MKSSFLPLICVAFLFTSCEVEQGSRLLHASTLEGSVDDAWITEHGNSTIKYNSKTKTNVIYYTDAYLFGQLANDGGQSFGEGPKPPAGNPDEPVWGLRFGLEYIGKGAKFPGATNDFSVNLNYLAVPLDVMYHVPAGPGLIQAGLGPYLAYGIGGSTGNVSSFGQDNGGFKRFDAGLNLQAGYRFESGLSLRLAYDLGLANVEYASEDVSGHTRAFSINVGFQIGKLFKQK